MKQLAVTNVSAGQTLHIKAKDGVTYTLIPLQVDANTADGGTESLLLMFGPQHLASLLPMLQGLIQTVMPPTTQGGKPH